MTDTVDSFDSIQNSGISEAQEGKNTTEALNDGSAQAITKLLDMQQRYDNDLNRIKPSRLRVLSIEGSDPIGGAGTMADMKAFTAQGVFGYAAMTSVLAQNTQGVTDIVNVEPPFLLAQLKAISNDADIDAMKIGMLGTPELVDTVRKWLVDLLNDYEVNGKSKPTVVLDPVMYAKSGDRLLTAEAEQALTTLIPLADIITPNAMELAALGAMDDEAELDSDAFDGKNAENKPLGNNITAPQSVKTGHTIPQAPRSYEEMERLAKSVATRFGVAVYAKGGALALNGNKECTDILAVPNLSDTTAGANKSDSIATKSSIEPIDVADSESNPSAPMDNTQKKTASGTNPNVAEPAPPVATASARTLQFPSKTVSGYEKPITITRIEGTAVPTQNVHGTGDTLSSTLAALRPQSEDWVETAKRAKAWMTGAITAADNLHVGHGHGPVDFTWQHSPTGMSFTEDYWRRTAGIRRRIAKMPFIKRMLDGTLPLDDFAFYLHQDDIYLTDYTSLLALASSRAADPHERAFFADAASYGLEEGLTFHKQWYREHGFSTERAPMSETTAAYLGHEHRFTDNGSYAALVAVVMPCYWVYSVIGQEMEEQVRERNLDLDHHPYGLWIRMYADPGFASRTLEELHICDKLAASANMYDYNEMMEAALGSTEHEYRFFDQALARHK
ncbi:bifunctional hydroxymethylpyrimidine kinase/phosphomethylpyrimidine kinase [Bifidobacterium sp. ESL0745]|uniref:bifunctional hydroxymethylpyrimidine kinase/phosphomethylpyrimidine kinase n=1 Tax=Bifidobacterium sp. ESL0745 TaxID=2983226 RepID=UPI0023F6AD33|nr:bifunctional hydroxymethylpyrimidine kinase/phosphomethylpyrimidine kinase [Bifidobacterium sp. ESL0745]MDF7664604.1 bifunctional hydroxymethylpyrimidine kinase/phosphomethylpyrimidine kinase [Bifidobacterium sp. ESL0745]